jgi:hypothetical protein
MNYIKPKTITINIISENLLKIGSNESGITGESNYGGCCNEPATDISNLDKSVGMCPPKDDNEGIPKPKDWNKH